MTVEFARVFKPHMEGAKRMYLPYRIVTRCPECDTELVHDLTDSTGASDYYLGHPPMNGEPFHYDFYCDDCEHEWYVTVVLDVRLRLATEEEIEDEPTT